MLNSFGLEVNFGQRVTETHSDTQIANLLQKHSISFEFLFVEIVQSAMLNFVNEGFVQSFNEQVNFMGIGLSTKT